MPPLPVFSHDQAVKNLIKDYPIEALEFLAEDGIAALGEPHLKFQTRVIQIPTLELERFRATANRVALSFLPNMHGDLDPVERVIHVALAFRARSDPMGMRKFFALWVIEAGLKIDQERELNRRLKEMDMPEIINWWIQEGLDKGRVEGRVEGLEEGLRQKAVEDARKMLDRGCDWTFITDITGIRPEDLTK